VPQHTVTRSRALVLVCGALVALAFFASCSRTSSTGTNGHPTKDTSAFIKAAQQGTGFLCTGDTSAAGCVCKWGHPDDPIYSCSGMEALCKAMGTKVECGDLWCSCGFAYPS
jgi:hypothetical protein